MARAEADRLVGLNATRALTAKHNAQLSCGRVQTPTLAMILARSEQIKNFKEKSITALLRFQERFNLHGLTKKADRAGHLIRSI